MVTLMSFTNEMTERSKMSSILRFLTKELSLATVVVLIELETLAARIQGIASIIPRLVSCDHDVHITRRHS